MTTENPDINVFKLVEFGAKVLNSGFISGSRDRAKQEFKKLKQGNLVEVGTVSMGQITNAPFKLQLDHSEFQGPGFGFDSFSAALTSMLRHTDSAFKAELRKNFEDPEIAELGMMIQQYIALGRLLVVTGAGKAACEIYVPDY